MGNNKPTEKEQQVLDSLTTARNPIKDTVQRLKISRRMVYKYIDRLKDKGFLRGSSYLGFTKQDIYDHPPKKWFTDRPLLRVHGIQFSINIPRYTGHKRRVFPKWKQHSIILYPHNIEIYSSGIFWMGHTVKECLHKMFAFYDSFFFRVQDKVKIQFYGQNQGNIDMVDGEIEEYDAELGKWVKKGNIARLQVRGTEDGIVWMEYDKSLKGNNIDFKHPKTFIQDTRLIVEEVMNSYRDGTALKPTEVTKLIGELAYIQKQGYADFYDKAVIPLQKNIISHLKRLQQEIRDFNRKKTRKRVKKHKEDLRRWL